MSMSELLIDYIRDEYINKRCNRYFSNEILEERIDACANCPEFDYNHCKKIGCSVYRFRQVILSETPMCPLGKHK